MGDMYLYVDLSIYLSEVHLYKELADTVMEVEKSQNLPSASQRPRKGLSLRVKA